MVSQLVAVDKTTWRAKVLAGQVMGVIERASFGRYRVGLRGQGEFLADSCWLEWRNSRRQNNLVHWATASGGQTGGYDGST